MAWMPGISVVLASNFSVAAMQPTLESDTASNDAEATDTVDSVDVTVASSVEADGGSEAVSLDAETTTDDSFDTDAQSEVNTSTTASSSTAIDDGLAPIVDAPAPKGSTSSAWVERRASSRSGLISASADASVS